MNFLAVDLGSTFIKAAIVDVDALRIRNVQRRATPERSSGSSADTVEINPIEVLTLVKQLIDDLLQATQNCRGILLSGQMGGLIVLDQFLVPQTPYISWQDRRACRRMNDKFSYFQHFEELVGDRKRSVLGNEFRPGLSPSLLYYLQQTEPQLLTETSIPVTLPDFIAAALCGVRPVTEVTNSPGVVSIADRSNAKAIWNAAGVPDLDWPELVEFQHCLGEYHSAQQSLPVYAATGDHQCSLVGTLLQRGELSVNVATGSQVSMLTADNHCDAFQLRPFFDGLWLKTITNIPAGRALTAILRLLTELSGHEPGEREWNYFFAAAEALESTDVDVNLGLFPGAIAEPGFFGNLTESNLTVGHIARAAMQEMARQYQHLATRMEPERTWQGLAFSGGLIRKSPLLSRLVSESLGSEYRFAPTDEDALFGLMVLGRVIAGLDNNVMSAIQSVSAQLSLEAVRK